MTRSLTIPADSPLEDRVLLHLYNADDLTDDGLDLGEITAAFPDDDSGDVVAAVVLLVAKGFIGDVVEEAPA